MSGCGRERGYVGDHDRLSRRARAVASMGSRGGLCVDPEVGQLAIDGLGTDPQSPCGIGAADNRGRSHGRSGGPTGQTKSCWLGDL